MTKILFDHELHLGTSSSVINHIYYSEVERLLFVQLHNGVLAGYHDVPVSLFRALEAEHRSDGSVGTYWNKWIKPNWPGYDTSDVELVHVDSEVKAAQNSFYGNFEAKTFKFDPTPVQPQVEAPVEKSKFTISLDEDEYVTLYAANVQDALAKFEQIAEIAGWDDSVVVAVTQFFD